MPDSAIPVVDITNESSVAPSVSSSAPESPNRRRFIKRAGGIAAASLMGAATLFASTDDARSADDWAEWFQGNYRLMTDEEKANAVERLERRYSRQFEKRVTVDSTPAQEGVLFGYALNIQKCTGCRRCVKACVIENNQSRGEKQEIEWIRVISMDNGDYSSDKMADGYPSGHGLQVGGNAYNRVGVEYEGEHYYDPALVPAEGTSYFPMACMQCEKPPCVKVCPVRTTYREPDGIVVVDYNWCIGCRCCVGACPYWARRYNFGEPNLPTEEMNPNTHYLGNRPRMKGVVEKCTFCIQRVRQGRYPACVEACPAGARKFGNLLDPESEVRRVLARKRVFRMKADLHTYPKFFYFVD